MNKPEPTSRNHGGTRPGDKGTWRVECSTPRWLLVPGTLTLNQVRALVRGMNTGFRSIGKKGFMREKMSDFSEANFYTFL